MPNLKTMCEGRPERVEGVMLAWADAVELLHGDTHSSSPASFGRVLLARHGGPNQGGSAWERWQCVGMPFMMWPKACTPAAFLGEGLFQPW